MHWISEVVRHALSEWGYWAIVVGLLGENAGLPLPGETLLIASSFLAAHGALSLHWIISVAIAAAVTGDNIAYWIAKSHGETLIRWVKKIAHLSDEDVKVAKDLIRSRGSTTIFFARFIFGLRTVAGLLAGSLGMEWRRFFIFNVLGAATWVTTMSYVGYAFGVGLSSFLDYFEYASWSLSAGFFAIGYLIWRKHKKSMERRHQNSRASA